MRLALKRAVGAAIVLHAISFLPVALGGLIFMAQDGLTLGRLRHMAEEPGDGAPGPADVPAGAPASDRPADAGQRGSIE